MAFVFKEIPYLKKSDQRHAMNLLGKTVSHYKILEKIGSGGMGTVYKARDIKLDRFVALKFLPPHLSQAEDEKKRFIQEAKASPWGHKGLCLLLT